MTLYKKSLHLKNWRIDRDVRSFVPMKGIEVAWQEADRNNQEVYATLIASKRKILDQQAAQMPILSERCRTLQNLPKFRTIGTVKERII